MELDWLAPRHASRRYLLRDRLHEGPRIIPRAAGPFLPYAHVGPEYASVLKGACSLEHACEKTGLPPVVILKDRIERLADRAEK